MSEIRTSHTCHLERRLPLSRRIFERVRQLTGKGADAQEDVQVARYEQGELYEGHFDGADPHDPDAEVRRR